MRDEEKLLRVKINELEKKKNQYSQELDMKQRTIQQLKVVVVVLMMLAFYSAVILCCLIKYGIIYCIKFCVVALR